MTDDAEDHDSFSDSQPDPPEVERIKKARNVVVGILAVLGVIWIGVTVYGSGPSPKSYITSTYTRAPSLDETGYQAYTTSSKDPQAVATEISASAEPIDRRTSTQNAEQNGGDSVFLQYGDEIIGLFPYQDTGTRVMLSTNYRTAHNHYAVYVGGWWSSSPQGGGFRGGGSGSGK